MTMDVLASFLFKEAMILTVITFFISWVLLMKRMSKRRAMLFWSVAVVANAAWWLLSSDREVLVSIARPAAVIRSCLTEAIKVPATLQLSPYPMQLGPRQAR